MADFSDLVYRGFGPHQRKGGGFGTLGVRSAEELEAALADGWFRTLPEAIDAHDKKPAAAKPAPVVAPVAPAPAAAEAVSDELPPTRAEIEAKCKELGIKVHHKHSDAKLLGLIDEALAKNPA